MKLRIEALAAGGDGVARDADGRVVFVPLTSIGDLVRVRVDEGRARFARARVEELLEPGPERCQPACSVFGDCGGCAWQHLRYPEQLRAKAQILRDALVRLGRIDAPEPIQVRPSPSPYGYRLRTRVQVAGGRVGYRRRRSHALCPTRSCPVLVPALDERLAELASHPPAGDAEWELLAGVDGVGANCHSDAQRLGKPRLDERTADYPETHSAQTVTLEVAGDRLAISPGVFTQSNGLLLTALARAVHDAAGTGASALELFAGAGFLTLGIARRFDQVVAVESNLRAVSNLEDNLAAAGLTNVRVLAESVEAARVREIVVAAPPSAIIVDPPRAGLPPELTRWLTEIGAPRFVYLSCDPATLARDLALLVDGGYALTRVEAFDLFPQTPHVEALAILDRATAKIRGR